VGPGRVYQWRPSTLSLGYNQDPETVDWDYCEANGFDVTRRPTGGGAIYHDTFGDISYSIVAPADELPGDLMETYELLCAPVLEFLRGVGVDADFAAEPREALYHPACYLRDIHPAHDIVAPDGRKISGNAQYRRKDAVIQHGSITFEVDAETHLGCFVDPPVTPGEFRERVTGIAEQWDPDETESLEGRSAGRAHAVRQLEETLAAWCAAEEGAWTAAEEERAAEIAAEKYGNDAWVVDREKAR
jgi:lipoate-protein ligase A